MAIPVLRSSEIRPRGLGRRVLRSSLAEALAYPHGVERYVEFVRPLLLARDVRAEVTAVRKLAQDHNRPRVARGFTRARGSSRSTYK